MTYKGGIYAIPLLEDSEVMYYNKALFAKYGVSVPTTWPQFLNAISVFKGHGVTPIALEDSESWEGSILFTQLAVRLGGYPAVPGRGFERGRPSSTTPTYVQVGDLLQSLVKDGAFNSDFLSEASPYAETIFNAGKAAMWDMGTWDIPSLWPKLGKDLGWFPIPVGPRR